MFIAKIAASVAMSVLGIGMVIFSDIYIRAGDRDGLNGIDAQAYDITGSIVLVIGVAMACYLVFSENALKRIFAALFFIAVVVAISNWLG